MNSTTILIDSPRNSKWRVGQFATVTSTWSLRKDHVGWVTRIPDVNKKKGRVTVQFIDGQKVSFSPHNLRVPSDIEAVAMNLQNNPYYESFLQSESSVIPVAEVVSEPNQETNTPEEISAVRTPSDNISRSNSNVEELGNNALLDKNMDESTKSGPVGAESIRQDLENSGQGTSETSTPKIQDTDEQVGLEGVSRKSTFDNTLEMSAAIKDTSNIVLSLITEMKVLQLYVKELEERITKMEGVLNRK